MLLYTCSEFLQTKTLKFNVVPFLPKEKPITHFQNEKLCIIDAYMRTRTMFLLIVTIFISNQFCVIAKSKLITLEQYN